MDNFNLIIINYVSVIAIILLIAAVIRDSMMDDNLKRFFAVLIILEVLELLIFNAELYCSSLSYQNLARVIFSVLGYTLRPLMLIIVIYSLTLGKHIKALNIFCGTVIALNTALAFSGFFSGIAFSFDEENIFIRGPLGFCFYAFAFLLLLGVIICSIMRYKLEKTDHINTMLAVWTVLLGMVLEAFTPFPGVSKPSFALATIFIYLHFEISENQVMSRKLREKIREDSLTGVMNRVAFIEDIKNTNDSVGLLYSDVNGLKEINDKIGHEAGDVLIKRAASFLSRYAGSEPFSEVYRNGGDEFIVLFRGINRERFEKIIERMKAELMSDWIVSCGGAWFENADNIDLIMKAAEKAMYAHKAEYYRTHPEFDRRRERSITQ